MRSASRRPRRNSCSARAPRCRCLTMRENRRPRRRPGGTRCSGRCWRNIASKCRCTSSRRCRANYSASPRSSTIPKTNTTTWPPPSPRSCAALDEPARGLVAAVLLNEVAGAVEQGVGLALRAGDELLQAALGAARDGIVRAEEREERLAPSLQGLPRSAVGNARRIIGARRHEAREPARAGLVTLRRKGRVLGPPQPPPPRP